MADPLSQLAHVAGPGLLEQEPPRLAAEADRLDRFLGRELRQEMRSERQDVLAAIGEGGELDPLAPERIRGAVARRAR